MELVYSRTKTIQEDKVSGFCPGCMHSTVVKLIGEALEEMNLVEKAVMVTVSDAAVFTWIISHMIQLQHRMVVPVQ